MKKILNPALWASLPWIVSSAAAQTIGAYWTFQLEQDTSTSATYDEGVSFSSLNGAAPTFSATGSAFTNFANFFADFVAFDGTVWNPGRCATWNANGAGGSTGNSFEITFDSTGAEDFQLRFKYRNNGTQSGGVPVTAFSAFEYSLGGAFLPVPGVDLTLTNDQNYNNEWTANLSALAAIENSGTVTLRWSLPDFDQGASKQSRVDDIQITGTTVTPPGPERTRYLPTGNYNVLFVSIDDLKPKLGAFGDPLIQTPSIDAFSATALRFTNAHCQQAICTASRTAVLTGVRPDTSKVWDLKAKFRDTIPAVVTLPQHFKNEGYTTSAVGKIFHGISSNNQDEVNSWSDGWSAGTAPFRYHEPANAALEDAGDSNAAATDAGEFDRDSNPVTDEHYDDGSVASAAIAKLQAYAPGYLNDGDPFFLGVGFFKPHLPFACPKSYWDLYDPLDIDLTGYDGNNIMPTGTPSFTKPFGGEPSQYSDIAGTPTAVEARRLIHGYMACVSYVDAQVGRVLAELDSLGLASNTVVVIWGDHGFHLADHGAFWAKHTNYENATRSPLLIRAPGMDGLGSSGLECIAPVELVDIFPTLVDLCSLPGANLANGLANQGTSVLPLLEDPAQPWAKGAFSQYQRFISGETGVFEVANPGNGMGYSVRTDRYRYTEWWRTQTSNSPSDGVFTDRDVKLFGSAEFAELYDYLEDPEETVNLATDPGHATVVAELSALLSGGNGWSLSSVAAPATYPIEYATWQAAHALPGINALVDLDPDADPDFDGIANLLEYKMGRHPLVPDHDCIVSAIVADGGTDYLTLDYPSVSSRTDVSMEAERSSTLLPGSFNMTGVETHMSSSAAGTDSLRARVAVTAGGRDFLRLSADSE